MVLFISNEKASQNEIHGLEVDTISETPTVMMFSAYKKNLTNHNSQKSSSESV